METTTGNAAGDWLFPELLTPRVLVDLDRVERNIRSMQDACDRHGVELWPHIKTHKTVEIARMQLEAGARGIVCAKIGEAEAMLPCGARRIFIANAIVGALNAPRLRALAEALDELILAATSEPQASALGAVLDLAGLTVPVMVAVDTGMGREGVRGADAAAALAQFVRSHPRMTLRGFYSHEGHAYGAYGAEEAALPARVMDTLRAARGSLDTDLPLWPGCSVTALAMAAQPGVGAVRPGTYVFGDLSLAARHRVMEWDDLAATVLTTVVDCPEPGLALLDAGSKVLSGDKSADGTHAADLARRDIRVLRCSEEHGWATGADVRNLRVGDRLRLVPNHVCPVINLTDELTVIRCAEVVGEWRVAARGRSR